MEYCYLEIISALMLTSSPEIINSCNRGKFLDLARTAPDSSLKSDSLSRCKRDSWSKLSGPEIGVPLTSRFVKPLKLSHVFSGWKLDLVNAVQKVG